MEYSFGHPMFTSMAATSLSLDDKQTNSPGWLNWLSLAETLFNLERRDSHELGYSQSSVWVSSSLFQKNCQCESTTGDAVMMGLVSPSGKRLCFSLSHRF